MAPTTLSCAPVRCKLLSSQVSRRRVFRLIAFATTLPTLAYAPLHADDSCREPGWVTISKPEGGISGSGFGIALAQWRSQAGTGPAVIIAGSFSGMGVDVHAKNIAAWNGQEHLPLGAGTNNMVTALQIVTHDDGGESLYAGGNFTMAGGSAAAYIARWDGTDWHPLGAGLNDSVRALAYIDAPPLAGLYASGDFTMAGDVPAAGLARWDGSNWHAVGTGSNGVIRLLAAGTRTDGSPALAIGGSFTEIDGVPAHHIALLEPDGFRALGAGINGYVRSLLWWPVDEDDARNDAIAPGTLIVGGNIPSSVEGFPVGLTQWDGSQWTSIGAPFVAGDAGTLTTTVQDSRRLLVAGGWFLPLFNEPSHNVMQWDGEKWTGVGMQFAGSDGYGTSPWVLLGVEFPGTNLVVAGNFRYCGSTTVQGVAQWNGTYWAPLSHAMDNRINVFLPLPDEHDPSRHRGVIAGGVFTTADGVWLGGVGLWDGHEWQPLGGGFVPGSTTSFPEVQALAIFASEPNGEPSIFAGGNLGLNGCTASQAVARFNGVKWECLGDGIVGAARALAVFDDGNGPALYAAGFLNIGGGSSVRLARWNGFTWQSMDLGGWTGFIRRMQVIDLGEGPRLVIAGTLTQVDGVPVDRIAQWDGHTWSSFPTLPYSASINTIDVLAAFDEGDGPRLYISGSTFAGNYLGFSYLYTLTGQTWSARLGTWWGTIQTAHAGTHNNRPALYLGGNFHETTAWDIEMETSGLVIFTCPETVPLRSGLGSHWWMGTTAIATFHPANGDASSLLIGGDFRGHTETGDSYFTIRCLGSSDRMQPCPGDIVTKGVVDGVDLQRFLFAWRTGQCPGALDFDGNGSVDSGDLIILLNNWGPCP